MDSGIDVTLDKWDLKEGHDAHAFMEKMVSDPDIKKVGIISDRKYAEKSDARVGGVGVEAQIITPEIYSRQDQNKFVAIVSERGEDGSPYLPVYYKSRIYIDLSDETRYSTEFERLVRWAHDQPLHLKPAIGAKPAFLSDSDRGLRLATSVVANRTLDSIKNGRPNALASLSEYLNVLSQELDKLAADTNAEPFDEEVKRIIDTFRPYRDEYISIVSSVAMSSIDAEGADAIHRFFESLIKYLYPKEDQGSYKDWDFDGYIFIIHEMYLYTISLFIKNWKFELASRIMQDFYVSGRARRGGDSMQNFTLFRDHMKSLEHRNQRLKLNRVSLRADFLKERSAGSGLTFDEIMQADFILYLRAVAVGSYWWPETLLYFGRFNNAMEVFARSKSSKFFARVSQMISVQDKADLSRMIEKMEADRRSIPHWNHHFLSVREMTNLDKIATQP
jgi:hypothetical protein